MEAEDGKGGGRMTNIGSAAAASGLAQAQVDKQVPPLTQIQAQAPRQAP